MQQGKLIGTQGGSGFVEAKEKKSIKRIVPFILEGEAVRHFYVVTYLQ